MSQACSALDQLAEIYERKHEKALQWKEKGGHVIGCLGEDVPEELLIAAGYLPVRIFGDPWASTENADRYLEQGFDPYIRSRFEQLINQTYSYLDRVIISNSSDALIRAYYYLRAIRMVEPEKHVPDPLFFDFLHTRFRMSALYNRERFLDLKKVLEDAAGREISLDNLAQAIAVCNENRQLLKEMSELRTADVPCISGVKALQMIGSSMLMPRAEHNELMRKALAEARSGPPLNGFRLFVTGSSHDHTGFYEVVESCGAVIVGEDHDMGCRHYEAMADPTVDPVDAIVDRYHLRTPGSSQATVSERVRTLTEKVRELRVQGVIMYIRKSDDSPAWDFPEQRKVLQELGIPVLLLDRQPYRVESETIRAAVASFVESIHIGEVLK